MPLCSTSTGFLPTFNFTSNEKCPSAEGVTFLPAIKRVSFGSQVPLKTQTESVTVKDFEVGEVILKAMLSSFDEVLSETVLDVSLTVEETMLVPDDVPTASFCGAPKSTVAITMQTAQISAMALMKIAFSVDSLKFKIITFSNDN